MDLKSHALYHLYGPKLYIEGISGLLNSTWSCIGPKSRLNLENFLILFTVCESLLWSLPVYMHSRVRMHVYNRTRKFLIVLNHTTCVGVLQFYRCGVHYLEANLYWKVMLGVWILSAVRNQETSASRRLLVYLASTIVISIHNTAFVCCREVVHFSVGPLCRGSTVATFQIT